MKKKSGLRARRLSPTPFEPLFPSYELLVTSSCSFQPCVDRFPRPPGRFALCELGASLIPTDVAIRLWRGGGIPPPSHARGRPSGRDPSRPCELPRVRPCALASAL